MDSLYVVAKPDFTKADLAWLTNVRKLRAKSLGPPRFTLVFPGAKLTPDAFATFVASRAAGVTRIGFRLRSAIVVPEPGVGCFHVFLVPDEGFGAIVRLHDRLHVGPLEACLRPDMPYLPHLTVATETDYAASRKIAAAINAHEVAITATIETLQIEVRHDDVPHIQSEIHLEKAGWLS